MKKTRSRSLAHCFMLPGFTMLAAMIAGRAAVGAELLLTANTPVVPVTTMPAGRNFIPLPELEYTFMVEPHCAPELEPDSLSLSIADTRVSMPLESVAAASGVEILIRIPAAQIGPIVVQDFCVRDAEVSTASNEELMSRRIPGVLSAQASLLCTANSTSEMTYASRALDVTLACTPKIEPAEPTPP